MEVTGVDAMGVIGSSVDAMGADGDLLYRRHGGRWRSPLSAPVAPVEVASVGAMVLMGAISIGIEPALTVRQEPLMDHW